MSDFSSGDLKIHTLLQTSFCYFTNQPWCLISASFCLHIFNFVDFIQLYLDIKWPFVFPHTNTELVFSQKLMFYHDDPPDHSPITQLCCGTHSHTDTQRMKPLCMSSTLLHCYSTRFSLCFPVGVLRGHHYDWWGLWLPYKAPCPGGLRRGEDHLPVPIYRQQVQPQVHHHSRHWLQGKESGELCLLPPFLVSLAVEQKQEKCSPTSGIFL